MKESTKTSIGMLLRAEGYSDESVQKRLEMLSNFKESSKQISRMGKIKQAAEILAASDRTVRRYAQQGLIRTSKINARRVLYNLVDAQRLAENGVDQ